MEVYQSNEHTEILLNSDNRLEIAKHLCAFANTTGGTIYVGIRQNGKTAGCEPSEAYSHINEANETLCLPVIPFSSELIQDNHKIILKIVIPKSSNIHKVYINLDHVPYIRLKNLSLAANSVIKKYLELKHKPIQSSVLENEKKQLIELLKQENRLTFSQICKKITLNKSIVELAIIHLLIDEIVHYDLYDNGIVYVLND